MGKRKKTNEEIERKIRKLQRKLNQRDENSGNDSSPEHVPEHVPQGNMPENNILIDLFGDDEDSQNQTESVTQPLTSGEQTDNVLDSKILEILGDTPADKNKQGPSIHNSVAERWMGILSRGLDKEVKLKITKKYLTPANCPLINAPRLNLEIKAAVSVAVCKKDRIHEIKQNQLSTALACLGQAMDILIKGQDHQALKAVSDAARLLCDQQYFESLTRRHLILAVLNKTTKDAIQGVKPDEWLFGKDLSERVKACKAVSRSANDLKSRPYRPNNNNNRYNHASTSAPSTSTALNWRGPSQSQQYRPQAHRGGLRQARPTIMQYKGRN